MEFTRLVTTLFRCLSCQLSSPFFGLPFRSRVALELENVALRHQLNVLKRSVPRPRLTPADRSLWVFLSRVWPNWRAALAIVRPETVIAWHRQGFRLSRNLVSLSYAGFGITS